MTLHESVNLCMCVIVCTDMYICIYIYTYTNIISNHHEYRILDHICIGAECNVIYGGSICG